MVLERQGGTNACYFTMAAHCRCNINELRMLILELTLVSTIVLLQMHGNHWILAFGDFRLVPHMLPMIFCVSLHRLAICSLEPMVTPGGPTT